MRTSSAYRPFVVAIVSLLAYLAPCRLCSPSPILAITPSRFEIQVRHPLSTHSLRVMNVTDSPIMVRVAVVPWDLDEANRVRLLPSSPQTLDQWMIISPLRFELPPQRTRTVRFSIRPPSEPEAGEHRAMIYFEQMASQPQTDDLDARFRIGVAVYGYVGEPDRRGRLHAVTVDTTSNPVTARFDISCDGLTHVRLGGHFTIRPSNRPASDVNPLERGVLPGRPVLPGTRRTLTLTTSTELPPGEYRLDLDGTLGQQSVSDSVLFTISGTADAAPDDGTAAGPARTQPPIGSS